VATDRAFILRLTLLRDDTYPEINKAYYPAAATLADAKPVLVVAGADAASVDVTFTPAQPFRDPALPAAASPVEATGTGRIAGIVTDATSGKPIRAAQVSLLAVSGAGHRTERLTRTDARGRFEYLALVAARYSLRAQALRFIPLEYGQTRPGASGTEIEVRDGSEIRADMKLARTSALEGTILDEFGDPAPDVVVQLAQRQFAAGRQRLMPVPGQPPVTDDRGHYRVPGLSPGDYYLTALTGVYTHANDAGGFAPTYYPGTVDSGSAVPVSVPFGADAPTVTFALAPAKTFSVTGTMVGADGRPAGGRGTVWLVTPDRLKRPDFNIARGSTQEDGTFVLRNVPQGQYTLQGFAPPPPPGPSGRGTNLGALPFGWLPVAVADTDVDGLVLRTSEGTTVRGRIITEESSGPPLTANQVLVMTIPVEFDAAPVGGGPSPFEIRDDLTFELTHQSGLRRLFVMPRGPWTLKKILLNGQDVTDTPIDLHEKNVDGVEVVLTSKLSRVSGVVTEDKGPAADYAVVIFSSDPNKWIDRSRFVVFARPMPQGRFSTGPLPADDYLAVALPSASPQEIYDPEFLQSLRTLATSFTLNEGETKSLELKLRRRP
jgi:5-hydroxyisourate hydrolase-like protein (transthyretin family)